MQNLFKKALPHILVLSIAFLITFVYLLPSFKGKVLEQHDIAQWRGGAQEVIDYKEKHNGEQSHWTNSMFSGMPSYFVSLVHEGNKTGYITYVFYKYLKPPVVQTLCAILCFYILMISFRFKPWISIIGAFAFAYASFNFVSLIAGHNAKLNAYAFIPLMFAGMNYAFIHKKYLLGSVLLGLGLATNLMFNHFQITFYGILGCGIYGLYFVYDAFAQQKITLISIKAILLYLVVDMFVKKDFASLRKSILFCLIGALVGFGTNASALLVTQEYSEYSIRGKSELKDPEKEESSGIDKSYAFEYSYGIGEIATFYVPGIYGGSSGEPTKMKDTGEKQRLPLYHGELGIAGGTIYIGVIIFALAIMSIFMVENHAKWAFWAITLIGFMLAWGKNLETINLFLFDVVPGLNKFRSVMMALMISQFSLVVLAMMTLNSILTRDWTQEGKKQFKNAVITLGGVFAITLLAIMSMDLSSIRDAEIAQSNGPEVITMLKDYRKSLAYSDFFRSLFFAALTVILIYFAAIKESFKKNILIIVLLGLVVIDMIGIDARYLNKETFVEPEVAQDFTKTAVDEEILKDKSLSYRVYNLQGNPFNDAHTSYLHKSLGGYNPVKIRRYQELIEKHLYKNNMAVINMLNAKYLIVRDERMPVRQNPEALGNAWFVEKIKYVNNPNEEIAALDGFEPRKVAIMDKSKFTAKATEYKVDSTAKIELIECQPNKLKYISTNANNGLAVFSEIYYPKGWNIKIDGKETQMARVNYVLRAMEIPAGKHTIEFYFESESYNKGYGIALVCSISILIAFAGVIAYEIFKSIKSKADDE